MRPNHRLAYKRLGAIGYWARNVALARQEWMPCRSVNTFDSESDPAIFQNPSEVILRRRAYGGLGMPASRRAVCALLSPFPLSSEAQERGMKTGTLTPGCAPLSLTRGYSHVTPNGVS